MAPWIWQRWGAILTAPLFLWPLLTGVGCADGGPAEAANLGVAGASCTRTPDCRAPLQCIGLICTALGGEGEAGDVATASDGVGGETGFPRRQTDAGP